METNSLSREQYVRKLLDAYRQTPGTTESCAEPIACWPLNCISAECP